MSSSGTGIGWLNIVLAGALVCTSALFSGLTLGLMSLDLSALSVLAEAGDENEREYAKKIIPLRRNGNLLLCTLLVGNTVVNSFLSILLGSILPSGSGLLAATALIVIFGEIAPQAICSRHGLFIGSKTRFVTWACVGAFFVVAWPISKVLDLLLGREVGTMYSREELKHLIKLQVNEGAHPSGDGIDADEHNLLAGALEYSNKEVKDVMTPVDKVFMLEASTKLTFDAMLEIYKSGFTRIPVYDGTVSKDRVISVLYVKDLILVDPDDEIEVQTVVSFRGPSQVRFISDQTPLNEVFKIFKTSFSHLMISIAFYDPDSGERLLQEDIIQRSKAKDTRALSIRQVTGVITLEDILEEVIKAEIIDEHDTFVANDSMQKVHKGKGRPDMATFLSLFDHKAREHSKLSRQEVHAITAFLTARVKEFALFEAAPSQLRQLVQHSTVIDVDEESSDSAMSDDSVDLLAQVREEQIKVGSTVRSHTVLYRRGEPSSELTLVLQGRAVVWAGSESFQSEIAPWSCIGNNALLHGDYCPDFTAVTTGACRLLQVSRHDFEVAAATVRKAQEARALRFSGSMRETPSDRRRSRLASEGKDLASLHSQGSIVIHSPAQSRDQISVVMHGRSASSATNSPMQSARQSRTNESVHPKSIKGLQSQPRMSSSQLQPPLPSAPGAAPANGAIPLSRGAADSLLAAGGSGGLLSALNGASRDVAANGSGAAPDVVTSDARSATPAAGKGVLEAGDTSTAGAGAISNGASPFTGTAAAPFSIGAPTPSGPPHHASSEAVQRNTQEGSNGVVPCVTNSTNVAAPPITIPAENSLQANSTSTALCSHASMPAKPSNGLHDSHRGILASTAPASTFASVSGVCTPAGGSSAPQSGSMASLKGVPSSRMGEQHTTHDSEGLRGIVMLGDGGEPVCLDETQPGDMFLEDPHTVEEAAARRWERTATMRRGSNDLVAGSPLPLAPVESGSHSALFRAMTPGETLRRQQPGWRQSREWNSPRHGSGEEF